MSKREYDESLFSIDTFESQEAAAEQRYDKMYIDADHYRCSCGAITNNSDMNFPSPNPYSEPCCNKCMDEYMEHWKSLKGTKNDKQNT